MTVIHPPRFDLDRYVADELEGRDMAAMEVHLAGCELCQGYVSKMKQERDDLMS